MATINITLGNQNVIFDTDTFIVENKISFRTAKSEAIERTSFGENDDVFKFDPVYVPEINFTLDCLIFTSGNNYVGEYMATVDNYKA